jgi:hypothetical protein
MSAFAAPVQEEFCSSMNGYLQNLIEKQNIERKSYHNIKCLF